MKKIVFFTGGDDLYGANKILYYTIPLFNGYKKVLCLPNRGKLSELIEKTYTDVQIITIPTLPVIAKKYLTPTGIIRFILNLWKTRSSLKSLLSDSSIVYLNTLAVLPISFYSKKFNLIHIHEILENSSLLNRIVNKIALKKANKIICVSEATFRNLDPSEDKINKIEVVHNGIPPIQLNKPDKSEISDKIKIILIGRIKPQIKGQNYVLDSLKFLSPAIKDKIEILFVGSPVPGQEEDLANLEKRIKAEDLSHIVTIKPFTSDITSLYEEADICLVPSVRADPFPTTVLEAMSAKKPVIGTNLGGIPEMINNNITGFIIPANNPQLFAEKIEKLVTDEKLRSEMGNIGYEKFLNQFTMEGYVKRFREANRELKL